MRILAETGKSRQPLNNRNDFLLAIGIALTTFAMHFWQTSGMQEFAGQFSKYPVAANKLIEGSLPTERLFDYSQVYLRLCALIAQYSSKPFQLLHWTQLTLVALSAAGFYLLLRRYFNRSWAALGVAAFALNPSLMIYGYIFEPEVLLLFLLIAAALLAEIRTGTSSLATGFAVLLSLLTRPVFILLAIVIPVSNRLHLDGRRLLRANLGFLLPVLAGLALFAGYTITKGVSFPPPLMNPGVVFFEGNNPLATGSGAAYLTVVNDLAEDFPGESDYQHAVYRLVARQDTGLALSPTEVNRFWSAKGWNFLLDEPAHAFSLGMNKLFFVAHGFRWHDIRAAAMVDKTLCDKFLPQVPLGLVVALALVGMVGGFRRWREFLLPYTVCVSQTGLMLVTYASDRQRLALLPFLILFALLGLQTLVAERRRLWLAGLVLFLVVIFSRETGVMRDNREVWSNYDRFFALLRDAQAQRDSGQVARAVETTVQAVAMAPWASEADGKLSGLPVSYQELASQALAGFDAVREDTPTARLDRILLLTAAGRLDEADRRLVTLLEQDCRLERSINRPVALNYYRGRIAALRGDRVGAIGLMKQALVEAPGDPDVLAQLAALTGDRSYVVLMERYFDRFDGCYYLGRAFLENGDAIKAAETLQPLQRHLPEYWKGKMYLAAARAEARQDREATESFIAAMRQRSEPAMFQEQILPAFRRQAEAVPPERSPHFWYGKVLRHFGFYEEARKVLRASLAASGRSEVAGELRDLEAFMAVAVFPRFSRSGELRQDLTKQVNDK